jgi:hypothetical protein
MSHFQFSLFGFQKPKAKVPISKARIEEIKEAIIKGDSRDAVAKMRDLRESLEHFEQRIKTKNNNEADL